MWAYQELITDKTFWLLDSFKTFNIFQVFQYFTIYRRYLFLLKFEQFSWISYSTPSTWYHPLLKGQHIVPLSCTYWCWFTSIRLFLLCSFQTSMTITSSTVTVIWWQNKHIVGIIQSKLLSSILIIINFPVSKFNIIT